MAYIVGTYRDEVFYGDKDGNDTIIGNGGNDRLYGRGGNSDLLIGGPGADVIDGGEGADTTDYRGSSAGVTIDLAGGRVYGGDAEGDRLYSIEWVLGSNHDDTLRGSEARDQFSGADGSDLLKGYGGDDRLDGDAGDDTLKGGGGADALNGGAGYDTVSYTESPTRVFVSLADNVGSYGDAAGDTFAQVENVTGSAHNDDLWGHNGGNVLSGMAGADRLKGYGGSDTLNGGDGDDVMDGGAGYDTMIGGLGNDTFFVDSAYDVVTERGGQGRDVVRTSVSYSLPASNADIEVLETTDANGTAALTLIGNSNANQIFGNNGANVIVGGGGADAMAGRAGNDTYFVDNASDRVVEAGGQGRDTVRTSVSWALGGGADVELVMTDFDQGVAAIDLTGNSTSNGLRGNNGSNTLSGREGADTLVGLGGQDRFLFDTALAPQNVDRVVDFVVADDTIVLDQTIFSSSLGLGNISSGELVIGTAAQDANDRIIYNNSTGALFYDADGAGGTAQMQFATLNTGLALTSFDFLVVA